MMFGVDHDFSAWGWVLMSLSMVAFWVLVIVGIVAAVRSFGAPPGHPAGPVPRTPQDVLGERYARGEIEEEEYQRRLQILREAAGRTDSSPVSQT
jgi:putative membrane protein